MDSSKLKPLDKTDYLLLDTLQKEARISNVELAKRVHLSPSPCLERVKRLEEQGYIDGYKAKLNSDLLNLTMAAFIQITLDRTTGDVFDNFRDAIVDLPEVAECHMVAGGFDYLVKLRISDMQAYRDVLARLVELPGISQTHTYVVIEEVKPDNGLYLRY